MEDDGSDAMDPQANEEFEPGALSSLEYPNSSDDIADITEIDPPEAHCDLGTNVNTNAMDPVDALTENVSACSDSDGEMETVQEASLGPNPEDVPANFQSEYEGSPRQGRAGLQQAIDNLMATEMEGKPDQPPESQASSLYEEGHYIQIPPWEEDATDNTNSNLDATVDHGTADKGKGRATEYDCQEEAYFTRHDLSDKIPWHAEEQFQRSEDPSFEKEVRFTKTKGEEESIQQPLEIRSENGENGSQQGDQELFVQETAIPETSSSADEQPDALGSKDSTPDARPKKKRVTLVPSEKEKAESRELGLRQLLGTDRASKMPILDLTEDKPSQRGTRQKTHRLSEKELESLWKPGSILSSANANASLPEIPTFTSTDKSKALNELIAALDPGDQPAAKLASYEDVRRSYPLSRLPKGLKSKEEIEEWWAANYGKFLGLLHKMKWQRIVLDGVTLRDEIVELCTAEKVLYVSIKQKFAELVNNLCSPKLKERQWRCILTMYLKLRMFTSHLLTAQDVVQAVLRIETLNVLKLLEGEQDTMDNSSRQIIKMIRLAKDGASAPVGETTPSEDEIPRLQPTGDREKLVREFKAFMEKLHEEERWQDSEGRVWCALCGFIPVRPIITSCKHLYCEECFHQLPDNEGVLGTENRLCNKCTTPIVEAAQFEVSPNVHSEETESSTSKDIPTNAKRKRQDKSKKPEASKRRKNASRGVQESAMFSEHDPQTDDNGEENEPCVDPISDDWIPMIGSQTPGAKLIRVRELLVKWIEENRDVKIIIFTQFLDTVRLLMMMCHQEGWGATKLTGKMAQIARDRSIISFREDPDLKVMISSLKTGGVGLDLSAANKCILLDLWWNEALQEQAYGRLYRNGQKREVEFVKIVAKGTIDENKLLQLQHEKTEKIRNVISQPVLENRKAFEEILKAFGNVTEVKGGGFRLELDP
ncbi:hypothetical protein PoHVEF18_002551 [Penicillium ochrochloron]